MPPLGRQYVNEREHPFPFQQQLALEVAVQPLDAVHYGFEPTGVFEPSIRVRLPRCLPTARLVREVRCRLRRHANSEQVIHRAERTEQAARRAKNLAHRVSVPAQRHG